MAQNLAEMGLAEDPNKAVPIPKKLLVREGLAGTALLWGMEVAGGVSAESIQLRSTGQVALDQSLIQTRFLS